IPQGEQLHYVHMGFGSVYTQDLILAIHRGKVILAELYENSIEPGALRESSTQLSSELVSRPADLFTDEEWGFVVAVHSDRSDLAQALVYCDWLTDQGDIRGDYLRMRLALLGLSDAEMHAHPSAKQLAEMERNHLTGHAWWLRLLRLV